jgi:catechol 2,3-dioxygenase-like lactoylglutathione lyase family enzyme
MKRFALAAALILALPVAVSAQGGGTAKPLEDAHVKGIRHVGITVSDIDATIAFYSKAVPYKIYRRYTVSASKFPVGLVANRKGKVEIALIELPTGFLQLMDFDPAKPALPNVRPVIGPGYTHICFQSHSLDPAIKRFINAGLVLISRFGKPDGVDIGGYGVRYAYGTDPDGIMIENESLDAPKRSEPAWVTHIANTVHDRDAMLAFYEKLIGTKPHRTIEQENRPRLDDVAGIDGLSIKGGWLSVGNMEIEVWEYVRPRTPAPSATRKLDEIGYNSIGFEVADLKAETKRLKTLGVTLAGAATSFGGWKIQYAYDPEGNLFSIQQNVGGDAKESVDRLIWMTPPKA